MKRPSSLSLVNLGLFLLLGAGVLHDSRAQSFGDFLKDAAAGAARQAVGDKVREAVSGAVDRAAKGVAQPAQASRPAAVQPDAGRPAAPAAPQCAPGADTQPPAVEPGLAAACSSAEPKTS